MADLPSAGDVTALVSLLAPGLVILGVRSRFTTANAPDIKDKVIAYAVASTAYVAAVSPLFHVNGGISLPTWLWSFLQYFLVPLCIGVAAAYIHQWNWMYRLAKCVRLRVTHHMPAAWDYAFERMHKGTYVLVRLTDGTQFAGLMGPESFASSAREERDLLIEQVWKVGKDGKEWTPVTPTRSVLLCGKDIRFIEIFRGE
ncbi:MAG: DUF6338 family protein [Sphingomonas pseudosanguinis]|uniref:DUF6338 family protein n=1 Tax=Sphingomonas pseudosanguinis TaxID=413712 RepID=UPI00391B465A